MLSPVLTGRVSVLEGRRKMTHADLDAAAREAGRLASAVAAIRSLPANLANAAKIKRLVTELNQSFPDARSTIKAVELELRRTRDAIVRLSDIVAPTAHEAAVEMVLALNRELFGVEFVDRGNVKNWPDVREVIAEIKLETTKAIKLRDAAKPGKRRTGRPKRTEKDSTTKVVAALSKHHGYEENGSVTNYEPATNRELAKEYDLSPNALSRFLTAKLRKNGHKMYRIKCRKKEIGILLTLWRGELPGRLADLLPEASGRGEDD
jgi:hypothetical protein